MDINMTNIVFAILLLLAITVIVYFVRKEYMSEKPVSDIEVDIDEFLDEPAYKRYLNHAEDNSQEEAQENESKSTKSSLDKPSYLRVNINEHSKRHHDWIASQINEI